MFKSILVPVDPAAPEAARPALARVSQMATETCDLRLVAVIQPIGAYASLYLTESFEDNVAAAARKALGEIAEQIQMPKSRVTVSVRFGGIYHEVLEEANAFNADLIVVASHTGRLASYMIGSNAASIARHADCSVLVVRD